MGHIVIFTDDPGWHGKQLSLAFANLGYNSDYVSLTQCSFTIEPGMNPISIPSFQRALPDAAFVRGVPGGSLEEVVLYLDFLHALKVMNIPVYNDGYAIERSVDKGMTSFLLHNAGLPTPLTWVLRNREDALTCRFRSINRLLPAANYIILNRRSKKEILPETARSPKNALPGWKTVSRRRKCCWCIHAPPHWRLRRFSVICSPATK